MRFHAKHLCFCLKLVFFFTPGIIKCGGEKPNIIPAYSLRCFRAAADATGCQVNCPAIVLSLFPFRVNIHYYE